MERIKMSELPKAVSVKGADNVLILQDGSTKTTTMDLITKNLKGQPGETGAQGATGPAADLQSYQKKDDETLTTTAKTIVGAINELVTKYTELQSKYTQLEQKIAQHHPE